MYSSVAILISHKHPQPYCGCVETEHSGTKWLPVNNLDVNRFKNNEKSSSRVRQLPAFTNLVYKQQKIQVQNIFTNNREDLTTS